MAVSKENRARAAAANAAAQVRAYSRATHMLPDVCCESSSSHVARMERCGARESARVVRVCALFWPQRSALGAAQALQAPEDIAAAALEGDGALGVLGFRGQLLVPPPPPPPSCHTSTSQPR
eukprot:6205386-Pleurochrysis_carterae.AAC.1